MKDLKELFIGINIKQKYNQKMQIKAILQDFILMLSFKEIKDCLFLFLTILLMVKTKLKETIVENSSFQGQI